MKVLLKRKPLRIHYPLFLGIVCIIYFLSLASDLPKPGFLKQKVISHYHLLETDSVLLYAIPLFTYYTENQMYDSIWGIMKYHVRSASKVHGTEYSNKIFDQYKAIFEECYSQNPFIQTQVLDEAGMLLLEEYKMDEAQEIFQNSLQIREKFLNPIDTFIAVSYALLAESNSYEGEYILANEFIEKAIKIRLASSSPDDRMLAVYYLLRASTRYDKFEETERDILSAIAIFKKHHGDQFKGLNICYNNLSNLYYDKGLIDEAIQTLMVSIRNHEVDPAKNLISLATNYANLSRFYWGQGKRENAIYYCNKALTMFEEKPEENKYFLYNIYDQAGGFYQALGYYPESEIYFEKSKIIKEELFGIRSIPYAQYLFNIATSKFYQNQIEPAIEGYKKSAEIRGEILGTDHPLYADCISDLGECYQYLGKYEVALEYYKQSSLIYGQNYGEFHRYHISDLSAVATINYLMGNSAQALELWQKCLSLSTRDQWSSSDYLVNPSPELIKNNYSLNDIVINKHKVLKEIGIRNNNIDYLIAAYKTLDLSISDQNKFYYELEGLQNRKDLVTSISEIYRYKADLAFILYEMTSDPSYSDDIFKFSENSKAFNLRDILRGDKAASYAGIPDTLVNAEKQLSHQIRLYMENKYDSEDEQSKQQFLKWHEKLDSIRIIFRDSFPQYAEIRYNLEPITRQQTQQNMKQDECLLIMMKGIESYYSLFITKNDFRVEKCGHISMMEGCLDEIHLAMNDSKNHQFSQSSNYIYNLIFGNIADKLTPSIVWIPDAYYHQLNPEILVSEVPADSSGTDFSDLAYLLHDYEFIVNHSVVLTQNWYDFTGKEKATHPMLGISPFSLSQDDSNCAENDKKLIRLPWSEKALGELNNQYQGNFLVGEEATKSAVLPYLSNSNILHFGTHAITNNDEPLRSGLVLACDQKDPSWEGRNLSAAELYGIPLKAKLAVLTACQTGKGKFESGEGVISLARAFNFGGCPSLLMTLWSVDDKASSEIVLSFYHNLRQQLTISNSLHTAKKEYLKTHKGDLANPVYWAGMVMIGENQIVLMETKSSLLTYGPAIIAGAALLFLALFFLNKKRREVAGT